jgi:hypothetical protein
MRIEVTWPHSRFYCPTAKLSVELDGFQHGLPQQRSRDEERESSLTSQGIEELRFWNHQRKRTAKASYWKSGRTAPQNGLDGRDAEGVNHRYVPPKVEQVKASQRQQA